MARASLNPDKAKASAGGIEAGNYEVIAAKAINLQTDYKPNQLYLQLELATLDKDGDKVRGAEEQLLNLSFGPKSHLSGLHPGNTSGRTGDVDDMGSDIDVEGNTFYAEEGAAFNASSVAAVFLHTLAHEGFPKEVLDAAYLPDFKGLKFRVDSMSPKDINAKYGTRLNTKPMKDDQGQDREITYKVVTKWLNPTYLKGDSKKEKGESKGEDKSAAAPSDPQEITVAVLKRVAAARKDIKSAQQLKGFFTAEYTKAKNPSYPAKLLSECQKLLADEDFMIGALAEVGGEKQDDGSFVFSA